MLGCGWGVGVRAAGWADSGGAERGAPLELELQMRWVLLSIAQHSIAQYSTLGQPEGLKHHCSRRSRCGGAVIRLLSYSLDRLKFLAAPLRCTMGSLSYRA